MADGATVSCGGAVYQFGRTNPGVLILAHGTPGGAGPGVGHAEHQLDSAWRRLMRAYGVTMPRALARSAAGRHRMKRVVR